MAGNRAEKSSFREEPEADNNPFPFSVCPVGIAGTPVSLSESTDYPGKEETAVLIEAYVSEDRLDLAHKANYKLSTNRQHNRLTKKGVAYIINEYAVIVHEISDRISEKVKCHMLHHPKAVHLLQAGINLVYIRDFLGHSDIRATETYVRADTELKRKALRNAQPDLVDSNLSDWNENSDLTEQLSKL